MYITVFCHFHSHNNIHRKWAFFVRELQMLINQINHSHPVIDLINISIV